MGWRNEVFFSPYSLRKVLNFFRFHYTHGQSNYTSKEKKQSHTTTYTMSKANTKDTALGHRETHKHEEGFHPTAKSHGVDKSMIAQGNHQGSGYVHMEERKGGFWRVFFVAKYFRRYMIHCIIIIFFSVPPEALWLSFCASFFSPPFVSSLCPPAVTCVLPIDPSRYPVHKGVVLM